MRNRDSANDTDDMTWQTDTRRYNKQSHNAGSTKLQEVVMASKLWHYVKNYATKSKTTSSRQKVHDHVTVCNVHLLRHDIKK